MVSNNQINESAYKAGTKQEKISSALITLIITLVMITPLCGFLFKCGCDWPWLGFDSDCNNSQPNAVHTCPWCTSLIAGSLSIGFAVIAGLLISIMAIFPLPKNQLIYNITVRSFYGVVMFIVVATLAAGIVAGIQGYPLGVGSFLQ
jgi:hypothetical protein